MSVAAADGKANGSQSQSSGLALNAREAHAVIDDEVAPSVLTKRNEYVKAGILESEHDRELRSVADCLRMLHWSSVPDASAGPCPNLTTLGLPTMCIAPE